MKAIILISAIVLSGCAATTPLGKFTIEDATAASELAKANGDESAIKCYDFIANTVVKAPSFTPGLLYLNEAKRVAFVENAAIAEICSGVLPIIISP